MIHYAEDTSTSRVQSFQVSKKENVHTIVLIINHAKMSDKGSNNNTTSFASILAGVQKLRDASKVDVIESSSSRDENEGSNPLNSKVGFADDAFSNKNNANNGESDVRSHNQERLDIPKPVGNPLGFRRATTNPMINRPASLAPNKRPISESVKDVNDNEVQSFNKTSLYQSRLPQTKKPMVSKITIHPSQKGNPLIKALKNVPYEYTSILKTDYLINGHISVLFLSLKYHKLRPEYIYERIRKAMGSKVSVDSNGINASTTEVRNTTKSQNYANLQALLLLLDSPTNYWDSLEEITKACISNGITLLLAWSFDEAGEYISMLKRLDSVPNSKIQNTKGGKDKFDIIKGIKKQDYYSRLLGTLTSVKSINKTNVKKAASSGVFKNFKELIEDDGEKLQLIDGFGLVKVQRYKNTINEPFIYNYEDYQEDPEVIDWKEKCKKIKLERLTKNSI